MILTDRLRLRRFCLDDAPAPAAYRCDPDVARYQSRRSPIGPAQAQAIVAGYRAKTPDVPGFFQWAIELRQQPGLIGDLAVTLEAGLVRAVLGITVAPGHQRRGYAGEALGAVAARLPAQGVRRVEAGCDVRNTASARMLRRVGFREVGRESRFVEHRGPWAEVLLFGMPADRRCRANRRAAKEEENAWIQHARATASPPPATRTRKRRRSRTARVSSRRARRREH